MAYRLSTPPVPIGHPLFGRMHRGSTEAIKQNYDQLPLERADRLPQLSLTLCISNLFAPILPIEHARRTQEDEAANGWKK